MNPAPQFPFVAALVLAAAVFSCALYTNFSFAVTNPSDHRFFPPFRPHLHGNYNNHLGAEYFNIARSMRAGMGFANPFDETTGPTAWMPPVFPAVLAGLLWACDDSREAVMAVVVLLQVWALIGTVFLVLALAKQTTQRGGVLLAVLAFLAALLADFQWCFQFTHDWWLVLLALDLLVAGLCWLEPLRRWRTAAAWGLFGGLCALINPLVAFAWAILSLLAGLQRRCWFRLAIAGLAAALALAPWAARNYLVFGRWVPVKSNLAYELYQSQCLQPDGLLQLRTFRQHPYAASGQRQEYKTLGEMAYLDRKRELFWQAIRADPADFLQRAADRFLAATLWYEPFDRGDRARRAWVLWLCRAIHPLPFLGCLLLVFTAAWARLPRAQWAVMGVYVLYLLPYIGVSYYERYGVPLLGVKVLLVVWASERLFTLAAAAPRRWSANPARPECGPPRA